MPQQTPPGNGFLGWLGRQFGYVKKAVKTDVEKKKVVHREQRIQEAALPDKPGVTLRRTVIDEVIVERKDKGGKMKDEATGPTSK